jgi:hypothetical protein
MVPILLPLAFSDGSWRLLVTVEVGRRTPQEPTRRWAVLRTKEIYPQGINIRGYLFTLVEAIPTHTQEKRRRERERERERILLSLLLRLCLCAQQEHLGSLFLFWRDTKLFFIKKLHQFFVWQERKDDDDDALWWHEKKQQF